MKKNQMTKRQLKRYAKSLEIKNIAEKKRVNDAIVESARLTNELAQFRLSSINIINDNLRIEGVNKRLTKSCSNMMEIVDERDKELQELKTIVKYLENKLGIKGKKW